ncbi:Cation-independent mannose-6-phosphate receptor [Stylophora pistillata]|uniref:Cation-independent mannose-6-phosphate receptor n=2 Tax=Stylophora pistillata TaxID=50429 RepID=A0A2B4SZ88_STYPI|nr:Cation-independent mannose-6-phosphate receptor [Stylophora pistillata]
MMILRYCNKECGKGGTVNSTITFICDREQLKGGQPELIQSYGKNGADFIFRTSLVCPPLERECSYTYSGNTYDLQLLTSRTGSWNYTSRNKDRFWINICRGISDGPKGCPSHASVCMIRAGKDKVNVLGLTSTQMMTYQGGKLQLQYSGLPSDGCRKGVHPKVVFYFDCGSHVGQPSLSREEWSSCVVVINWKSSVACKVKRERIEENNCVVKHPVTGRIIDFKKLLNGSESTWKVIGRDEHVKEVSYYINVCDKLGKGTKDLPSGCNGDVASVCIENTPFTVTDKSIYYEDSIFSLEMTADKVVFVINFQCSEEKVGSPKFDYLSSNKHYFFTWTTSVVCAGELSREVTDIPEAGHKTVKSVGKKNLGIAFGVVFAVLLVIVFVVVFYKPSRRHKIISYLRVNFKTLVLRKEINYPTYRYQKLDVSDDDEADSLIKIAEGSDDEEENDDDDLLPF